VQKYSQDITLIWYGVKDIHRTLYHIHSELTFYLIMHGKLLLVFNLTLVQPTPEVEYKHCASAEIAVIHH